MATACAELLAARARPGAFCELARIESETAAWPSALWEAGPGGLAPARPGRTDVLPFIALGEGGYEAYLAGRSRNFRSQLGRRRRRLEREHGLSFRMTTDPEQLGADMDGLPAPARRALGRARRQRGLSGPLVDGPPATSPSGPWSAAGCASGRPRSTARPGASWYGWRIGERYCYALSGLRQELEPLALGTVLLAHTIEQAAAEGANLYDLMLGDEAYKQRFETGRRCRRRPGSSGAAAARRGSLADAARRGAAHAGQGEAPVNADGPRRRRPHPRRGGAAHGAARVAARRGHPARRRSSSSTTRPSPARRRRVRRRRSRSCRRRATSATPRA